MLNISQVWNRIKKLPDFAKLTESDLKVASYVQVFTPSDDGSPTPYDPRPFPNGSVIIGIDASAVVPAQGASGQSANNRQIFGVDFAFNGGESIVVDGPANAEALLGGRCFPAKEIIVAPNQQIKCRVSNLAGGSASGLIVHVVYHTLIWKYAG
jgi:hypothetical protein